MPFFRKSLSQHIVGILTLPLPGPLRALFASRIGAPLTLLALALLGTSGVVTLTWKNGKPQVSVDKQRAAELQDGAQDLARAAQAEIHEMRQSGQSPFSVAWPAQAEGSVSSWKAQIIEQPAFDATESFQLPPIANPHDGGFEGPLSRLRERIQGQN